MKRIGIIFFILVGILFGPVAFGNVPFPADYMLAWHEPWSSLYQSNGVPTLPHKPIADDTFRSYLPFKSLAKDVVLQGMFPLWNPYNGAGMPLLGMMQVHIWNPLFLFFFVLPPIYAWTVSMGIEALFLCCSVYIYQRKLGISEISALFSSIIILFSSFTVVRLLYGEFVISLGICAVLFWIIECIVITPRTKSLLIWPLAVAWLIDIAHPQMTVYVLTLALLYGVYRGVWLRLFVPTVLGVALMAVQIVPTIELYTRSHMTAGASAFIIDKFLMPPQHYLSLLIPNFFGNTAIYNFWGRYDYVETALGVGSVPVAFALYAVVRKRQQIFRHHDVTRFFFFLIAGTLVLTLNTKPAKWLYQLGIPLVSTGVPTRMFGITTLLIGLLAGIGMDRVMKKPDDRRYWMALVLVGTLLTFIFVAMATVFRVLPSQTGEMTTQSSTVALRNTGMELIIWAIVACMSFAVIRLRKSNVGHIAYWMLPLVIAVAGLYNALKTIPYSRVEHVFPNHSVIESVKRSAGLGRVVGIDDGYIRTNLATWYRFYDPQYYTPLYLERYGEFISYANSADPVKDLARSDVELRHTSKLTQEEYERRERAFDMLGVSHVLYKSDAQEFTEGERVWQEGKWNLVQRKSALPRAYFVSQVRYIANNADELAQLFSPSFDPKTEVILETPSPVETARIPGNGVVEITRYRENVVELAVSADTSGMVVLSDNDYPGWKAFVDGTPVPIYRANYTFRAVPVNSGSHHVEFIYNPPSFLIGISISLSAVGIYIVFVTSSLRRSRMYDKISL